MAYSAAFYANFNVLNTNYVKNINESANISWLVTCTINQFQQTFSIVYQIPVPSWTDTQIKNAAFESQSGPIMEWANDVVNQAPLTLGATGTYQIGPLFVDGPRVGIGTTGPTSTLQVQGDCNLSSASAYKIQGNSVLSATALGSSVTTSSLTTLGVLSTAMDLASGQTYKINNTEVLTASALGSSVTSSSLTSVGVLNSLTTNGNVQFKKSGNTNVDYNAAANTLTFGEGNTGGQFSVIGSFVQGVTGTTGQVGNSKFGYRNVGRYVELGADSANQSYIDFHSNDGQDVDYDARILSVTGVPGTIGGGQMNIYARRYVFQGYPNSTGSTGIIDVNSYMNYAVLPSGNNTNIRQQAVCRRVYSGQMAKNTATAFTIDFYGDGNYPLYGIYTVMFMNKAGGYYNNVYSVMRGTAANPGNTNFVTWVTISSQGAGVGNLTLVTGNSSWLPQLSFTNTSSSEAYFIVTVDAFADTTVFSNAN